MLKNLKESSSPESNKPWALIFAQIMRGRRSTQIAKMMALCWRLTFLWQGQICFPMHLYGPYTFIYIGSTEVTCRSTAAKIVLIGNLRWPPSCLCLLYFPATVLLTCMKSWFFRNHLANFHEISHWSYWWNVIDSLLKWSRSIDCQAQIIFFFKTKNCSNDDLFVSCDDRIGKMLHNICISAVAMSLRWARHGPWASCFLLILMWQKFKKDLFSYYFKRKMNGVTGVTELWE